MQIPAKILNGLSSFLYSNQGKRKEERGIGLS
jgi:hypothetical protein